MISPKHANLLIKIPNGLTPNKRPSLESLKKKAVHAPVPPPPKTSRAPRPSTAKGNQVDDARAPRKKVLTYCKLKGPVKPEFILNSYPNFLTVKEEREIIDYQDIYYIRSRPPSDRYYDPISPEHFKFVTNEHIAFRFQMLQVLGKGSFGGVIKCIDHKTKTNVAIKFLRDRETHHDQISMENRFLNILQEDGGPNNHHIIHLLETFSFHGFFAFVFELGFHDVYTTLKNQKFEPFTNNIIHLVACQAAEALKFIHTKNIIHCDFKPENILFTNPRKTSIKIIDFGCSTVVGDTAFTYIQSRFYRAPEVVLGLPYGPEIDIWGLGCVLCEMATGDPLFDAEDENELIQLFLQVIGPAPHWMIDKGSRSDYYFGYDGNPILEPNSDGIVHYPGTSSLIKATNIKDSSFLSLLSGCLTWDPKQRLTLEQFMRHPWVTENIGKKQATKAQSSRK